MTPLVLTLAGCLTVGIAMFIRARAWSARSQELHALLAGDHRAAAIILAKAPLPNGGTSWVLGLAGIGMAVAGMIMGAAS